MAYEPTSKRCRKEVLRHEVKGEGKKFSGTRDLVCTIECVDKWYLDRVLVVMGHSLSFLMSVCH